ncbi:MAG TPA: alpha-glucan family phosphorylase [Bryobacteraceae bacterium]|nr:alpha-glucan family phosphorylase [Bryobacteraceae bacterium]
MKPIQVFSVAPALPERLEPLGTLAQNLHWAWSHETIELFRRLDANLWESVNHNPVMLLGSIDQQKLENAAMDESFLAHMDGCLKDLDTCLNGDGTWFHRNHGKDGDTPLVAYFSAEFGLTECLSIFAGGLGVLAGDHLKSSSDLGIPLAGVGLLYQQGYFRQRLNARGWQEEEYESNDFHTLPLSPVLDPASGSPLAISVAFPGRSVFARVWKASVGRVSLYLLDTNVPENSPADRDITDQLYGGGIEMRLEQEILLGIGGCRMLDALGLSPTVFHMNEGHSAFLALEHVRTLMRAHGLSFSEARQVAFGSLIFTTHTAVPAGHDYFPPDLMERYFREYRPELGLSLHDFLALGRQNPDDGNEHFCMTILALRMAAFRNGVSKLHGEVTRNMWQGIWKNLPVDEIPIGHVTNGVHFRSWISRELNQLYDRYLGPRWRDEPGNAELWRRVESIPPEELWRTHERRRERLVAFARRRLKAQLQRRAAPESEIELSDEVLDTEALTIGFARRFATYKRATLLLRDVERLKQLLNNRERPVQLIFAGKAHPKDEPGKELIRQVVDLARDPGIRNRLVFLEDYDMAVGRYMVQGVDIWLNNPLRPLEASGTSGMKAAANGALNASILDGWWDEAWLSQQPGAEPIGWAIGTGERRPDAAEQDQAEAEALYNLLERDIVPMFYDYAGGRLPRRWIARMKSSTSNLCYFFNTHRMVREYTERFYLMAHTNHRELVAGGGARARLLAQWGAQVQQAWPRVHLEIPNGRIAADLRVGGRIQVKVLVNLDVLTPEQVSVELYLGPLNPQGEIVEPIAQQMSVSGRDARGWYIYETSAAPCCRSGQYGYTARVLPYHVNMIDGFMPGLISWAVPGQANAASR